MNDDLRAKWDERYASEGLVWGREPNRFVVEAVTDLPPGTALDLGCGQGRNALWLASRGHRVTGIDLSPVAIGQAKALAAEAGLDLELEAADLTTWEPGGRRWDLVLLAYLQLPPEDRRKVHAAAVEALAPGGTLVLVAHHAANLTEGVGGPPYPEVLYDEDTIREDFADLEIERCERVLRDVEGADRPAIDLLCIARKPA